MHHKDVKFADLTDSELDKLREAEKILNSQTDHGKKSEEIILLAFKQDKKEH